MVACDTGVRGACEYARSKTTPWRASASRLGVTPRLEPRKPIRSEPLVSIVITMTVGALDQARVARRRSKGGSKRRKADPIEQGSLPFGKLPRNQVAAKKRRIRRIACCVARQCRGRG